MSDQRKVIAIVDDDQTMLNAIERLLTARDFVTRFVSASAFFDARKPFPDSLLIPTDRAYP